MKKLLSLLKIDQLGLLEIMFAFYPIVAGYHYGSIPMSLLWLFFMDFVSILRRRGLLRSRLLLIVFAFVVVHGFVVWMINGFQRTQFNYFFSIFVFLASIFIVAPALDYKKMVGAIYLISYLVCAGIIYHFVLLLSGGYISPIPLPFLPAPDLSSRLFDEMNRPCSFFWEPASFVTFMMIPLFISLMSNTWHLTTFFLFCIFLSTSTNGIVLAPLMIVVYIILGKQKVVSKLLYLVVALVMVVWLFNSPLFEKGIDKLENTDYTENVRISNGPWLVSHMPFEHLFFGMPVYSPDEYLRKGYVVGDRVDDERAFYLSDFWHVWVTYGIFGLIFHLLVFFYFIRKDKTLWPYIAVLLVAQFSQSMAFQSTYMWQLCFIISYIKNNRNASLPNHKSLI